MIPQSTDTEAHIEYWDSRHYRLEYNEHQGCFHHAFTGEPLTDGWIVLAISVPNKILSEFGELMFQKYINFDGKYDDQEEETDDEPKVYASGERMYPDLKTVQREWKEFTKNL